MNSNYGASKNYVKTQFVCHSENVGLARMLTGCFVGNSNEKNLDLTVSQLEEIKVAVSEAVSNAIIHGYNSDNKGIVTFELTSFENALVIKVSDSGVGIADIEQAVQPSFSTKKERMGLGFAFMNSFMDEVNVQSELGKGTMVTMIKKLPICEDRL